MGQIMSHWLDVLWGKEERCVRCERQSIESMHAQRKAWVLAPWGNKAFPPPAAPAAAPAAPLLCGGLTDRNPQSTHPTLPTRLVTRRI